MKQDLGCVIWKRKAFPYLCVHSLSMGAWSTIFGSISSISSTWMWVGPVTCFLTNRIQQRWWDVIPWIGLYYIRLPLQFSRSVMSNSLWPHEQPQHARPPCPSPSPGVHPNPCPLSWWCHPTISSSVVPFSSCPQSFPASGSLADWIKSLHLLAWIKEDAVYSGPVERMESGFWKTRQQKPRGLSLIATKWWTVLTIWGSLEVDLFQPCPDENAALITP